MRRLLVASALLLLAFPGFVRAEDGVHRHDGFFLQLDLGGGRFDTEAPTDFGDLDLSGAAGQFGVIVGGAVRENLILGGHLWGVSADEPDAELGGQDLGEFDGSVSLSGLGLNVTYYLMPVNVYLSVTPSITRQTADPDDGDEGDTENGFGMRFAVGKEWWVSDNWGLGLNAQFAFSNNDDEGDGGATWKARWFGLAFSATFN